MKKFITTLCALAVAVLGFAQGHDDFNTLTKNTKYDTYTTTAGWVGTNCSVTAGTADNGIGEGNMSLVMNGKTTAVGSISSPLIAGGMGELSFNYCYPNNETNGIDFTVTVYAEGEVFTSWTVSKAADECEKAVAYTETKTINCYADDIQVVFTNNSPTQATTNKDRYAIWNVAWTGYEKPNQDDWIWNKIINYSFDDSSSPALTAPARGNLNWDYNNCPSGTNFLNIWGENNTNYATTISLANELSAGDSWKVEYDWAVYGGCNGKVGSTVFNAGGSSLFTISDPANWNATVDLTIGDSTIALACAPCDKATRISAATGSALTNALWHHFVITGDPENGVKMSIYAYTAEGVLDSAVVADYVLATGNVLPTDLQLTPGSAGSVAIDQLSLSVFGPETVLAPVVKITAINGIEREVTMVAQTDGSTLYYNTDGSEEFTEYTAPLTIAETTTFYAYAQSETGKKSEVASVTLEAGVEVQLNSVTFAKGDYNAADKTYSVTVNSDQSTVDFKPVPTIVWTDGAGNTGEVVSGTTVTASCGTFTAFAKAAGYADSESASINLVEVKDIFALTTIDFGSMKTAGADYGFTLSEEPAFTAPKEMHTLDVNGNDSTYTDTIAYYNFTVDNGEQSLICPESFGVASTEGVIFRGSNKDAGLYAWNGAIEAGFNNLKEGQFVTVNVALPATVSAGGVLVIDEDQSEGLNVKMRATADGIGTFTVAKGSYNYVYSISVGREAHTFQNGTFDIEDDFVTVGVCTYAKDMETNGTTYSGMIPVTGWTPAENGDARAAAAFKYGSNVWLGGTGYNVPETDANGNSEGGALGIIGVWTGKAQYTQEVDLPAGGYVLTFDVFNAAGTAEFARNLFGATFNGEEIYDNAKTYPVGEWTKRSVVFSIEQPTTVTLSLGVVAPDAGSAACAHLFIDNVTLESDPAAVARLALEAAIAEAEANVAAACEGEGLFMTPADAIAAYNEAIDAAKQALEGGDCEAALAALNDATATFLAARITPSPEQTFAAKLEGTEGFLGFVDGGIKLVAEGVIRFADAGNGQYYITSENGEEYVGYEGSNNWTLSASADKKAPLTVALVDGKYTLTGKNGLIGTNAAETTIGSPFYGDKKTSNGNVYYSFEDPTIVAIDDVKETALPVNTTVDLLGRSVSTLVKGNVYIINGKKVLVK